MTAEPLLLESRPVRNMMPGPTVIASDNKQTHEIIFAGKDDPGGNDVQDVPPEIWRTGQYRKAVRFGILQPLDGSEGVDLSEQMAAQRDAFWARAQADRDSALAVLESPADNDLIVINCIGPGTRPGAICGEEVPVRQREAMNQPPLCGRHAGLAGECMRRGNGPWELQIP